MFISVPPMLVVRSKAHMYSLGGGVHCILGTNGFVWVSKDIKTAAQSVSINRLEEEASEAIYSNVNEVFLHNTSLMARISTRRPEEVLPGQAIVY